MVLKAREKKHKWLQSVGKMLRKHEKFRKTFRMKNRACGKESCNENSQDIHEKPI